MTTRTPEREALQRLIDCAFRKPGESPRFSIPAQEDDDDLFLARAIDELPELRTRVAELEDENDRLRKALNPTGAATPAAVEVPTVEREEGSLLSPPRASGEAIAERQRIAAGLRKRAARYERNGGSSYFHAASKLRDAANDIERGREEWAARESLTDEGACALDCAAMRLRPESEGAK